MNNTTPPYSSGDISGVSNPKSLKELNKDAAIDSTVLTVYSIKQLASTANTLYNSGESAYSNGSLESAYVYYMKGCSITLEVITRHVDYDNFKKESYHQQLEKRTVDALDILGIIKLRLEPGFKSTSTGDEQVKQDNESDSEDITRIMERYPDMPLTFDFSSEKGSAEDTLSSKIDTSSLLDSLPSVPMNLPGTTPQLKTPRNLLN
ncbi:hypothetical protein BDF14DRAFT_723591 [Spinellus fusiger]|nr:hypothetical protein BDF14DRAFT_723591 [Spinellus fusiger]